jgi:ABC-type glycerol-3-phosphate transport system substrate-binding protein
VRIALLIALCASLVACGGGDEADTEATAITDKMMWLWVAEGGKPEEFTIERFCTVQPEHCQ